MIQIPELIQKDNIYYCDSTIFNKTDVKLYFFGNVIINYDDANSFLPDGLYFHNHLNIHDRHSTLHYLTMTDGTRRLPNIKNKNGNEIVKFEIDGTIQFNILDKEKCEYILYCLYQLREYMRMAKECIELENLFKNTKSISDISDMNIRKANLNLPKIII